MQPVGVLGRVDPQQGCAVVEALGERVLDDERVDRRVGVQFVDRCVHLGLGGVRRKPPVDRMHAHLGAVGVLHPDVLGARAVVAHQDRAQTGGDTPLGERGDASCHVGLEVVREPVSVERDRSHRRRW